MTSSTLKRWTLRVLGGLIGLLVLVALAIWLLLRASLPKLDGKVTVSALVAPVSVMRDAQGVPTIQGANRLDVAYVTGYLHAQDRFFQMDLLRRVAAGELSALVGEAALDLDKSHRFHRFRARAELALKTMPGSDLQLLDRYAAGVNAGLAALAVRPFEYGLLNAVPQAWQPADSLLAVWAMYFDLQGNLASREFARGWLKDNSTAEQLAFLLPEATTWDAPLDASVIDTASRPIPPSAPVWWNVQLSETKSVSVEFRSMVGSNNWALAASRSQHGGAILANDMHLGIRLPHIWYRAVLQYPDAASKVRQIVGVTLPGVPAVVVGSNGHVAWGFTNSYGDYLDLIEVERDPQNPLRIKTAGAWEDAKRHEESINVKGGSTVKLSVVETTRGPIHDIAGRLYAEHWIAHDPDAVNLNLTKLEGAMDLASAQAIANTAGVPAQNMMAVDVAGHIGWTIAGPLPNRDAVASHSFPYATTNNGGWKTHRPPADYPRVIDPADGQLWTANNRQLAGDEYRKLGDGGADAGARARQIRDDLTALAKTNELGAYGVGLDDRALFVLPWRDRAMTTLDDAALANHPKRAEFRRLLQSGWTGHASVDSVGYRLARGYMHSFYKLLFAGADTQIGKVFADADYDGANPRWASVVQRLLNEQPAGWLPNKYANWHAVQLAAVDATIADITKDGATLASATWGQRNTARISHPFAKLMPAILQPFLSAPADQFAGDENMPRVAGRSFGQSERLVVSPGKEAQGIFNMPGGQSGHPLSPYFLAGHASWVKGDPTPLMPGAAQHTLRFVPM